MKQFFLKRRLIKIKRMLLKTSDDAKSEITRDLILQALDKVALIKQVMIGEK